jgi:polysaccharide biosynthesis/export protein
VNSIYFRRITMNKNWLNIKAFISTIFIFSTILILSDFCAAAEQPAAQPESGASRYLIGPDDLLNIFVWKEAELTQDVTVMPDGRMTYPLIGEIDAQGLTVTGLKDKIVEKLKNFISSPEVTVIVKESRSRRIYTIGSLTKPGPYQLQPSMTVLQALSMAGGFTEWADKKSIMIVRRDKNKEVMFRFNYPEFIAGKNLDQNILLEANDTIVVP